MNADFEKGIKAGQAEIGKSEPLHSKWNAGSEKPASSYFEAGYWKGYLSGNGQWQEVAA